ncbi:transporter substrate-binding domain-containing protein [Alteromonas sp. McT4-15]|uniref:diguanylate cyclase n=1 Tax=Alteromonas sp. McT4-15 TaxID=2881256 RepID=UPI001CF86506|nr:transporter substrate-binding domain-containing protein [Alteromonas sp. McT4-15]MCB4436537.1 transporter substrate-binding domain-containing protein [Alteromonas sp. McT4-15]
MFKCYFFQAFFWVTLVVATPSFAYLQNANSNDNSAPEEVTYCIDPNWAPYEAIRNGSHIGISAQYLDIISELSDLKFTLVPTQTWQQSLEYVQQGKCRVIPMLNTSDYRRQFLDFSLPYFEAPNVLVAKSGTPMLQGYGGVGNRSVGVVQGYRQVEYISRHYPSLRLKLIASEQEGLKQLANGEFDVMVGSLMSVNMHINNLKLKDLIIVGYAEPFDSLAFGVNKSYGYLVDKINYAIERIPENRKVEIYKQWNNVQVRYSRDYLKLFLSVAVVLMVLLLIIVRKRYRGHFTRIIQQKNEEIGTLQAALLENNKTLAFLSSHDNVTGLYNRNHMIQRAEEEISRFQRFHTTASLIVVELTSINDEKFNFDTQTKEDALKVVAASCLSTVREVDVVSRFSDEQFIVLCPQTTVEHAKKLADRLLDCMLGHQLLNDTFKIAVGMTQLHEDEEFNEWFERTIKALYQSKRLGYGNVSVAD